MRNFAYVIFSMILYFSCNKEEITKTGSIFVTVINDKSQVVPNAQISTEPITSTTKTDVTGTGIISNVPIGGYKVNAFLETMGTGSASATVSENSVTNVTIFLISNAFENPTIQINQPINEGVYNFGDDVNFSANVSDNKDAPNLLKIEWSSSIDGVLNNNSPGSSGVTSFSTKALSIGQHTITLKVTDTDKKESTQSLQITIKKLPGAVVLNKIDLKTNGLELSWSKSEETTFSSYRINRSENVNGPFSIIDIKSDINTTNYVDENVVFGKRYFYRIAVLINGGDESFSNIESLVFEGENIDVGAKIVRMIQDPVRPYIYALDKVNNSLLFINIETRNVDKTIFVGSAPSDIDINLQNTHAYVANYGSNLISVIDLDKKELSRTFVVDINGGWNGNPYRLACLKDDKLVFTSEDQWNDLKMVNALTGTRMFSGGSIYYPGLLTNSDQSILYATESGSTGSSTYRFNLDNDALTQVDRSESSVAFGGIRDACISGDNKFIFYNGVKLLANNLQANLGSFSEWIVACNFNGNIAIGTNNIWNANNFSIIKPLPISSSIIILDKDQKTLYIYDQNTSKIFITSIE